MCLYGEYVVNFPPPDGVFLPCDHGLFFIHRYIYVTIRSSIKLQMPVVQLVTSKLGTLGRDFESRCSHTNWNFSSPPPQKKAQQVEND